MQYTWWRLEYRDRARNIGRRLDYFLVNSEFLDVIKDSTILGDVMGSDHCPIQLKVDLTKRKVKEIEKEEKVS